MKPEEQLGSSLADEVKKPKEKKQKKPKKPEPEEWQIDSMYSFFEDMDYKNSFGKPRSEIKIWKVDKAYIK